MSSRDGWRRVKFGDVVRQVKETADPEASGLERYVAGEHMDTDELQITRWGTIGDGYLGPAFHRRFRSGQVLYGSRRTYLRKVALADFDGICANTTFVCETKDPEVLLPELLPFIMQTEAFHAHSIAQSKGSVNPYINWADLAWYEFDLPPIDEQREIAELLWTVESLRRSLLRLERAAETALATRLATDLSAGRGDVELIHVVDLVVEGPRNGFSAQSNDEGRGVKTLAIGAIRGGKVIAAGSTKYAEVDESVLTSFPLRRNDVLVVRGNGNKMLTARAGIVEQDLDGYIYPDLLIKLRFDPEVIDPRFACIVWNLPPIHGALIRRAKSTNGIWKINGKDIKQHRLPVPPVKRQEQMLSEIATLESARNATARRRESARAMLFRLIASSLHNGLH